MLNESTAVSNANASAYIANQDNSESIEPPAEPEVDESLKEKMVELFKTPKNFNWAWQFFSEDQGDWIQFDCPECLLLEFSFQAH